MTFRRLLTLKFALCLLLLVGAGVPVSAQKKKPAQTKAQTSAEIERKHRSTQDEIKSTRARISENDAKIKQGINDLNQLNADIATSRKNIETHTGHVASLQKKIIALENSIKASEKRLEKLRSKYLEGVKKMRMARSKRSKLAFIFSSKSFSQAMRRMRYLKEIARRRDKQTAEIRRTIDMLNRDREALAASHKEKNTALSRQMAEQKNLDAKCAQQKELVSSLQRHGNELQAHLALKQAEANELKNQIGAIIAAEQEVKAARKAEAAKKTTQPRKAETTKKAEPTPKPKVERPKANKPKVEKPAEKTGEKPKDEKKHSNSYPEDNKYIKAAKNQPVNKVEPKKEKKPEKVADKKQDKKKDKKPEKKAEKKQEKKKEKKQDKSQDKKPEKVRENKKGKTPPPPVADNKTDDRSAYAAARRRRPRERREQESVGGGNHAAKDNKSSKSKPEAAEKKSAEQHKKHEEKPKKAQEKDDFAAAKGSLPRPVEGSWKVVIPFGVNPLPELPSVKYDNPGIDVQVSPGATAKAVFPGVVSGVYQNKGYGTVVLVNHGSYYTVYANLSSSSVHSGDHVKQGQSIGKVFTDKHDKNRTIFHFEVWHGRDKLNPAQWIR